MHREYTNCSERFCLFQNSVATIHHDLLKIYCNLGGTGLSAHLSCVPVENKVQGDRWEDQRPKSHPYMQSESNQGTHTPNYDGQMFSECYFELCLEIRIAVKVKQPGIFC